MSHDEMDNPFFRVGLEVGRRISEELGKPLAGASAQTHRPSPPRRKKRRPVAARERILGWLYVIFYALFRS